MVAVCVVTASCPSNGNTNVIYITSNMGDNIWSFDTRGQYLGEVINRATIPEGVNIDKLRTMRFGPGGHLYVSSARGSYSRIFALSGNGLFNGTLGANCTRDYLFTVAALNGENPFMDHPYDMVFHPETNDLYVSNQNTVTITRYLYTAGKNDAPRWEPAPNAQIALPGSKTAEAVEQELVAAGLAAGGAVVVSRSYDTDDDGTGVVLPDKFPTNAGLFASAWNGKYFMNSARGMAMSPKLPRALVNGSAPEGLFGVDAAMGYYLLVCDIAASVVHVFDADSGERLFGLWVPSPVQVVFPSRYYEAANVTVTAAGGAMRPYQQQYVYVTSKEESMTYVVRFSSRSSSATSGAPFGRGTVRGTMAGALSGLSGAQSGIYTDDAFMPTHRLKPVTTPTPLQAASGIYENPSRDILLLANRNGRKVSMYASPFAYGNTDPARSAAPTPYLGLFVKQLPDQPEFILSVRLEDQKNIPFCYELSSTGKLRYVALCAATRIWSTLLILALIIIPTVMLVRHMGWLLPIKAGRGAGGGATAVGAAGCGHEHNPLLGGASPTSYGAGD